jgi:hypothetical protein
VAWGRNAQLRGWEARAVPIGSASGGCHLSESASR